MNPIVNSRTSSFFRQLLTGVALVCALVSFFGCNEEPSKVGGSIMPGEDALFPRADTLHLDAHSILIDSVYDRSTYALLGELSDPLYGNLRASYISRFQNAYHYKTEFEPIGGDIDSTFLEISYSNWVGDSTVWSKVTAYEIKQTLPDSRYSGNLQNYLKDAEYIGSHTYQAGNKEGKHKLRIPVNNELGKRIYKASKEHPEYFTSQQAFEENLLRGIYVHATTGNGCMLSIYSTAVVLSYRYEKRDTTKTGADTTLIVTAEESFVNTKQLYLHRQFETDNSGRLLTPNPDYAYITSPQGLALSLTLSAEELSRTFLDNNKKLTRLINEAPLSLHIDPPDIAGSVIQPATYLLLVPVDSLNNFFEMGETERSQSDIAYLSSAYNITSRVYEFKNISRLIHEHIRKHIQTAEDGTQSINTPLELVALPVSRETMGGNAGVTATISNFIYPSGARVRLKNGKIALGIVSTAYIKD